MTLMTSDLSDAIGFGPLPKDWYTVRAVEIQDETSNKTQAPMLALTLMVETGEYAKKRVFPPYRVMLGGVTEKGEKQRTDRVCELINATNVEWKCNGCGASGVRKFVKNDQQKYLCPDCMQVTKFSYDTDHFRDKVFRALLSQEKGFNSEEMVNSVARVAPLS